MCANYYRRTMYVFCVRIHAQAAQACGPRRPIVSSDRSKNTAVGKQRTREQVATELT